MRRICDDPGTMTHGEEIMFLNSLIIDLKKQLLGYEPTEPITMDRLNDATDHLGHIQECRKQTKFY